MDLSVAGKFVKLCPLRENDVTLLNRWYHEVESFRYATGGKKPEEILIQSKQDARYSSFVSGIYRTVDNTCVGLIAGEYKIVSEPLLWIRIVFIDSCWRRKRYGTMALQLLFRHSRETCRAERAYVSVYRGNAVGTAFWKNCGFSCVKILKAADSDSDDIIIMEKVIGL
ncbi:MAG: GNAT family N-acetyltransferase [Clostridiaceae bacterium]|nr:GNAT family N-acetyltransferase [Clostridiaceae bacterium]